MNWTNAGRCINKKKWFAHQTDLPRDFRVEDGVADEGDGDFVEGPDDGVGGGGGGTDAPQLRKVQEEADGARKDVEGDVRQVVGVAMAVHGG